MGRAHAYDAGTRARGEAQRVVGTDGARLRPQLGKALSSVVVTGAAKGIGSGIAEAFAKAGWSVVAVDRDKAPLEQTAKRIGGAVVTLAGDVADRATNDAAVKLAVDRFGGLDAAVGDAGGGLAELIGANPAQEVGPSFSANGKAPLVFAPDGH